MSKKNILYVDNSISVGGSTISLLNIVSNLSTDKFNPIVACINEGSQYVFLEEKIGNILLLKIDFLNRLRPKFIRIICIRLCHITRIFIILKRRQIDLVHFNNGIYYPGIIAARLGRVPFICHLRSLPVDYVTQDKRLTRLNRFFGSLSNSVIAISENVKLSFLKLGLKTKRIIVINDGLDIVDIKNKAVEQCADEITIKSNEELIIGTLGRLSWEKGIVTFIESAPLILSEEKNVKFFIVGDGPLMNELKNKSLSMGLTERIIFTGWLSNPFNILSKFDVFVLSSFNEGLSASVMQAMAFGLAVVATNVGGVGELINDGQDGILVEPGNPKAIANAVLTLLKDKGLRERIGKNAAFKAGKEFILKNSINKIELEYKKILNLVNNN